MLNSQTVQDNLPSGFIHSSVQLEDFYNDLQVLRQHGGEWLALSPQWGLFLLWSMFSLCLTVCTHAVWLIDSKLPVAVNVSVNGCMSL